MPCRKATKKQNPALSVQLPADPLTLAFISTLQIRDIRYDLSYYGSFFRDIPQLLGHSSALDAASMALMASYPFFRGKDVPPDALIAHGRSLRVLRETLSDPKEARSPHTMCAIYLISVCTVRFPFFRVTGQFPFSSFSAFSFFFFLFSFFFSFFSFLCFSFFCFFKSPTS